VFSSAERESAYVMDGLMQNEVVKSDIHSTDAFGFSELVFAVSHLLGFSCAPRCKNLERQRLYIFRSRKGSDRNGASKLRVFWDDQRPRRVGELSPRFQPGKVRRDALLTADSRDILG
jgi:hypothetical protein